MHISLVRIEQVRRESNSSISGKMRKWRCPDTTTTEWDVVLVNQAQQSCAVQTTSHQQRGERVEWTRGHTEPQTEVQRTRYAINCNAVGSWNLELHGITNMTRRPWRPAIVIQKPRFRLSFTGGALTANARRSPRPTNYSGRPGVGAGQGKQTHRPR